MNTQTNQPAPMSAAPAQPGLPPATPPTRADEDVLDAAWAQRVEAVIRAYGTDPQRLSGELASLRAQYQQARFGKAPFDNEGHA